MKRTHRDTFKNTTFRVEGETIFAKKGVKFFPGVIIVFLILRTFDTPKKKKLRTFVEYYGPGVILIDHFYRYFYCCFPAITYPSKPQYAYSDRTR